MRKTHQPETKRSCYLNGRLLSMPEFLNAFESVPVIIFSSLVRSTLNRSWCSSETSLSPNLEIRSRRSSLESQRDAHPEVVVRLSETSDMESVFWGSSPVLGNGKKLHAITTKGKISRKSPRVLQDVCE